MKNYFEGWYFKIVDPTEKHIFAIIPGVSFDKDGKGEAFIQFFDGVNAQMEYVPYPLDSFDFDRKEFTIQIGKNSFSAEKLQLNLDHNGLNVTGQVSFSELRPWPVSLFQPGVMGWYRYVPKMECYHGVISFDHALTGSLDVNGNNIDFKEGNGYIEKDYGRSFPRYYIWCQSNHFQVPNTSLMVSFAKIPWMRSYFDGFIAGFMLDGQLYRFATYTGARVTGLRIIDERIDLSIADKKTELRVVATNGKMTSLPSPMEGSMIGRIMESITGTVDVKLTNLKTGEVIFEGIGNHAGVDIGGEVAEIPQI